MNDQCLAALFCQGQGNKLLSVKHTSCNEPVLIDHSEHLLRQHQFIPGLCIVSLGELRLIVLPKPLNDFIVLCCQLPEICVRPLSPKLLNVIEGEEVEKMDMLLSLARTGGDFNWI